MASGTWLHAREDSHRRGTLLGGAASGRRGAYASAASSVAKSLEQRERLLAEISHDPEGREAFAESERFELSAAVRDLLRDLEKEYRCGVLLFASDTRAALDAVCNTRPYDRTQLEPLMTTRLDQLASLRDRIVVLRDAAENHPELAGGPTRDEFRAVRDHYLEWRALDRLTADAWKQAHAAPDFAAWLSPQTATAGWLVAKAVPLVARLAVVAAAFVILAHYLYP